MSTSFRPNRIGVRLAAGLGAVVAALGLAGAQLGLAGHYTGQAGQAAPRQSLGVAAARPRGPVPACQPDAPPRQPC